MENLYGAPGLRENAQAKTDQGRVYNFLEGAWLSDQSEHACCFDQARAGVQLLGKVQATPGMQVGEHMGARRRITAWGVTPSEDSGFRVEWVEVSLLPDPGVKVVQGHSPMAGDAPREVLTRPPPISSTHLRCKLQDRLPLAMSLQRPLLRKLAMPLT